jgi:hypothetical protein
MPFFLILGVLGGLCGALFNFVNIKLSKWRLRVRTSPWTRMLEVCLFGCYHEQRAPPNPADMRTIIGVVGVRTSVVGIVRPVVLCARLRRRHNLLSASRHSSRLLHSQHRRGVHRFARVFARSASSIRAECARIERLVVR